MPRFRRGAFMMVAAAMLVGACSQQASAQSSSPLQQEFSLPNGGGAGANVDEFSGGFTFDLPLLQVPGPHGSGYDITLSYRSGTSPAAEASWVGYGWTLNPGAIARNQRGFADDWKDTVVYWNKRKRNWTVTAKRKLNAEITSADFNKFVMANADSSGASGKIQLSVTTAFNSYAGYSQSAAFGAWAKGLGNLSYTINEGKGSFSGTINPNVFLRGLQFAGLYGNNNSWDDAISLAYRSVTTYQAVSNLLSNVSLTYESRIPSLSLTPMKGESKNYSANFLAAVVPWFLSGFEAGVSGNYTWQEFEARIKQTGLGYMHSSAASGDANAVMDYYTERELPHYKDNLFLPIPFNNADNFSVSGSGIGGSFRLHNRGLGRFRPNFVESNIEIQQFGLDIHGGLRFGVGGDLGLGQSSFRTGAWDELGNNSSYGFEKDGDEQPFIFRFGNDLGGKIELSENDDPLRAAINDAPSLLLPKKYPKMPSSIFPKVNNGQAPTGSSAITFHTNREMTARTDKGVLYNSYNKDTLSRKLVDRTKAELSDQIGEFCIYNATGHRYVYGLPVYARAEKTMSLGLGRISLDSAARLKSNLIAHAYTNSGTAPIVVGNERYAPYATTYLLTEITTPDYIDRTNDGPTPDDYGGYTKFNYVRVAGATNKVASSNNYSWYSWRIPYNGFLYNKNSLSDPADDLGTFLTGQKEIYYLRSIETKTHIAIFVTNRTNALYGGKRIKGSMEVRQDGYQAYHPTFTAGSLPTIESKLGGDSTISDARYAADFNGTKRPVRNFMERLERIELYAKDENGNPGVLLSTVHLAYDYSLRKGMPNSIRPSPDNDTAKRAGMLTLRKVWWQGGNVINGEYSPYTFSYDYRRASQYSAELNARYPAIAHFADSLSAAEQNPDYSPFDLDRWGSYQHNGAARYAKHAPWVSQIPDSTKFDPAAWQLKRIETPAQGEIQVQYEQNTYSYVQDKPAMAMVSLASDRSADGDNTKYYLNVADIGIADTSRTEVLKLRSLLQKTFTEANASGLKEKIYFKLLYALKGINPSIQNPEYSSEYIHGYSPVEKIEIDSSNSSPTRYRLYVALKGDNGVPKKICLEYVKKNKLGLLGPDDGLAYSDNHARMITKLIGTYAAADFDEEDHCKSIDYASSYLRIPLLAPKKGGGIRVKRLLHFDKGLEKDTSLYGVEYVYEEFDERQHRYIGSGVAVNEPSIGREENALVNVWPGSEKPELANRIIAGKDKDRYEGIVGESLLPAAGVGYSRVVAKNIHSGRSNPGFSVSSFYTAKEFPFVRNYEHAGRSVHYTDIHSRSFQLFPLLGALASGFSPVSLMKYQDDLWLTQGYRFILNDMHGQFRSRAAYGGSYNNQDSWALSTLQEVSYFSPGEKVPMMKKPGDTLRLDNPGKTMEVAIDSRTVFDQTIDGKVEGDLSIQSFIPFDIQPSGKAGLTHSSNTLSTHVTSKVVRYPSIRKGMLSYADGIYHYTHYDAFDPLTGRPVITHTVDGYDRLVLERSMASGHIGAYHSYQFPAAHYYQGMGGKMNNERVRLKSANGLTITKALGMGNSIRLAITSTDARTLCDARQRIVPGDLIRLTFTSDKSLAGFYHVDSVSLSDLLLVYLLPVSPTSFASGNLTTGDVDIEVIRSGYTNQLAANVGEVTTYGTPESVITYGDDIAPPANQMQTHARRQLATLLNGLLAGGGHLDAQQVGSLGITMRDPVTGDCDPLSIWVNPNYNGQLVISVVDPAATAVSKNYLLRSGNQPGAFAIDGSGRLVYNAFDNTCCPQAVTCVEFCPKYNQEAITGVISASARTFDHRNSYDAEEFPPKPDDGNPYELGTRGKWRAKAAYAYRTGIRGGSERAVTERNYADAGIFNDFLLFDWKHGDANDYTKWLRLDTAVRYSPHGDPREMKDVTGISSASGSAFGDNAPRFEVANATASSVAFQSFEDNWEPAEAAHSGSHSKMLLGALSHAPFISAKATPQTLAKGLSLRFWLKVSDYAIVENLLSPSWIEIYMNNTGANPWFKTFRINESYKIAQTGEWTLYEVVVNDFNGVAANDPINVGVTTNLKTGATNDTAWIDDVRMQPLDAEMICYVPDRKTMRLAAVLDDQHFGTYNQYNAEGTLVRQIAETDRGMRTVVESHDHLPRISRVDNGAGGVEGGGGGPQNAIRQKGSTGARSRVARAVVPQFETNGPDTKVDLFEMELGPDGAKVKTFGSKGMGQLDPAALDSLDLDEIGLPGLPDNDAHKGLRRIAELEKRQRELIARRGEGLTKEEQERIDAEMEELLEERKELLEDLGLSEEKWIETKERIESIENLDEVEEVEEYE